MATDVTKRTEPRSTYKYTFNTFNMNVLKAEIYKRIISDERSLSISKFRKKWLEYSFLVDEAHVYFSEIFA